MRILLISDAAHFLNGGANRVVVETCALLAARGHSPAIAYFTPGDRQVDWPLFRLTQSGQADEISKVLGEFRPDMVQIHTGLTRAGMDAAASGPTAIFCHDLTWVCSGGDRMDRNRVPCHRPHGLGCLPLHYAIGCGARNPRYNILYWLKTSGMIHFRDLPHARLQVASEYVRGALLENAVAPDRIDLVPLYSNPIVRPTTETSEPALLLLPSRLVPAKGVHVALEALGRIRTLDWRCVIAGDGHQRPALERLAEKLGLADRVRFLGEISPSELDGWYRRSRIVLFPVLRPEPFGLVGVEAMAHGRPVVAFGGGGADEWLADDVSAIRIGSRDPGAFAAAIARLLGDSVLWERLASGALDRHRLFQPEAYIDRLLASFARAKPPARRR